MHIEVVVVQTHAKNEQLRIKSIFKVTRIMKHRNNGKDLTSEIIADANERAISDVVFMNICRSHRMDTMNSTEPVGIVVIQKRL